MGRFLHAFFSPLGLRRAVPQVWDGFQTNMKLMVIAEMLVLVLALAIAIVRGLPGRGSFPLRALAVAYTDFFRGTPLILVAYVIALGLPSLRIAVVSEQSLFVYGVRHWPWSTPPTSPRSTERGSSPCTRASAWLPARSGSTTPRRCGT